MWPSPKTSSKICQGPACTLHWVSFWKTGGKRAPCSVKGIKSVSSRHCADSVDFSNVDCGDCSGLDWKRCNGPCQFLKNAVETDRGENRRITSKHSINNDSPVQTLLLPLEGATVHTFRCAASLSCFFSPHFATLFSFSLPLYTSSSFCKYIHCSRLASTSIISNPVRFN